MDIAALLLIPAMVLRSLAKGVQVNGGARLIAAVIFLSFLIGAQGDLCAKGSQEIDGNWFCQPVTAIRYSNVGTPGTYNQVLEMTAAGTCTHQPKSFSGPIAPLDEEVSLHFRGPLQLKQLAAYAPSSSAAKKSSSKFDRALLDPRIEEHHNHFQKHKGRRGFGAKNDRREVTATIDGQVVSWENNYFGPLTEASSATAAVPKMVTATIDGVVVSWVNNWPAPSSSDSVETTLSTKASSPVTTSAHLAEEQSTASAYAQTPLTTTSASHSQASDPVNAQAAFERIAYYDSESQTADNIAFLGNFGGQGSGVFDYVYGASTSYVNSQGTAGAASPQILADTIIPSDAEVIVMLGEACSNNDCGFVRPGAVAHHGFDGADKIFLMEFSMPLDDKAGFNGDMPAIWMLNAQIVHAVQYGESSCSCWESGCGEFDIAEALFDGSTYLKSTLHTNTPGGDSDYLVRPTNGTMKLAVIFSSANATIQIQVLPDNAEFDTSLSTAEVEDMCSDEDDESVSIFIVT